MQPMGKRKDDDMEVDASPFLDLRKNVVLRESRLFSDRELNPVRCCQVLTKLLYLLTQGEIFSTEEATEVFFAVTKLFQNPDAHLRRLVYLMIKELRVDNDSSLIVVSCLSKDMVSKNELFRANSLRVLASIMDTSMCIQMERFLKQALVDKNPFIQASALCAGQQLYAIAPDVVKRWVNEIQEALTSRSKMVQYHALALLYRIRANDKLALSKIVTSLARHTPSIQNAPMAQLLHIRIITSLLLTTTTQASHANAAIHAELLKYLTDCLHNKLYVVMYEAAKSLLKLDHLLTPAQLVPAISVLQEMLTSVIPCHRFAAVRTLSEVVLKHPILVSQCVQDLEHCINDANRSIATLAITTLLKTGVESNVDRLMKSISGFMAEISDDFKIVLVEAIRALCLLFPHKYPQLLNFLASSLREEGGYKYKKSIVDSILMVIIEIKEASEMGLEQFCEFIEDCEFPELSVRILDVLGEKGPTTTNPAKYIRFIFNRVILETASVRCAAVSSLARFGVAVPALTDNVIVLLQRCLTDNDDEVRDRALFYVNMLKKNGQIAQSFSSPKLPLAPSYYQLECSLLNYLQKGNVQQSFSLQKDLIKVGEDPLAEKETERVTGARADGTAATTTGAAAAAAAAASMTTAAPSAADTSASAASLANPHLALFSSIPELAALGSIFKSCPPLSLTEAESEYVVSCIKHILPKHVVFQFNVTNNMEQQVLAQVTVGLECERAEWVEDLSIPEAIIHHGVGGVTFVVFKRAKDSFVSGPITATLHFHVLEVDDADSASSLDVATITSRGVADEYQLEDLEVTEADFMRPGQSCGLVEFKRQWEELGDSVEVMKKYSLGLDSLQAAVTAVLELLGMQPCESTATVADQARSHAVNLTGIFFPDVNVLARAGFMIDPKHGVTLKIAVRSQNPQVNTMLTNAIR